MKQTATLLFLLALATVATAQVDPDAFERQRQRMQQQFGQQQGQARQQYDEARRKAEEEYAAFRKRANEQYAAAMQRAWQRMGVQPAVPKPEEPAPPRPPKPPMDKLPSTNTLPQAEVVPPAVLPPAPLPPIPAPEPTVPTMQVPFYGTVCDLHTATEGLRFRLPAVDEKNVSKAWQSLSAEKYDGLLHDCLAQREAMHLSDWGYLQLLGRACEQLLGKGSNEAVLLQAYLLAQSGYRVRLARTNRRLALLMPFNRTVYGYSYTIIDGVKHYLLSHEKSNELYVCSAEFPREQVANILMDRLPNLGSGTHQDRTLQAQRFGTMKATVSVSQRLIDFLNEYPLSDAWNYYALAGLSDGVKATLYPALRNQLKGKSHQKDALMLLDFVQTAFDYATDQEQFGYERPLFGDESLYYPKNDCEDRSILFAILVRDLLGLDVVLVHWPGHLATAVHFPQEVDGDYFTVEGRRYTVCDPTYIGAGIGETMPQFQNVKANLVTL